MGLDDLVNKAKDLLGQGEEKAQDAASEAAAGNTEAAAADSKESASLIDKAKELVPGKPIRYVINTHVHFDHSGGLRPFVAEGATIVTHESVRPFYEAAWANPRTLNPDAASKSGKAATFGFT